MSKPPAGGPHVRGANRRSRPNASPRPRSSNGSKKQKELADEIVVVYEAGAGGFHLYRQLTALGVKCYLVHPEKLDPYCKGVVTDKTDSRELVLKLDRYLHGNTRAMSVVRVR